MKFSELGIKSSHIEGNKIEIAAIIGKRILIEKVKIEPSRYADKNSSGMRLQMQVVLALFNQEADASGDFFVKNELGVAIGERRSCFTGSDVLIESIKQAEKSVELRNKKRESEGLSPISLYPIDTTIERSGKSYRFI